VFMDSPKGVQYGSGTASPAVQEILENTLRYLNIKPDPALAMEKADSQQDTTVPLVSGMNFSEALGVLENQQLGYSILPALTNSEDFLIVDQYPKAGEKAKKMMWYIYTDSKEQEKRTI